MSDLRQLLKRYSSSGRVVELLVRPSRGAPMQTLSHVYAITGRGLEGDRSAARTPAAAEGGKRQVTLIQAEHLPVVAALANLEHIAASRLRRNVVVRGINLLALRPLFRDQALIMQIGAEVQFEVTGPCEPCSKMEHELGPGGYNAMRGHGGVTARVRRGGMIRVNDLVTAVIETG